MNRIQEDENNYDELKKQLKQASMHKKDEIKTVANSLKEIEQALAKPKYREKMQIQAKQDKPTGPVVKLETKEGIEKSVVDTIRAMHPKNSGALVGSSDEYKPVLELLNATERELINAITINEDLKQKFPVRYNLQLKEVKERRKKKRSDMTQPKMLAEQKAKAMRNQRKMDKKNNAVVFKGKPLVFRARKSRMVKKVTSNKKSQADIDFERYVGQKE